MNESLCLPFRIPNLYGGLAELDGILRGDKDRLILDFEVKESVLELVSLGAKTVCIPLSTIVEAELTKGWFSQWIVLRLNSMQTAREVPGTKGAEVRLKVARKHANEAGDLVSNLQMALTANSVKRMLSNLS